MALPVYTYGSIPTDAEFNAFLRPLFDKDEAEEQFPGHLWRLRDDALSNDPTQLKPRWETFERTLQATAGTGLNANYQGGVVILPNGTNLTIPPGVIALPNNATSIIYVSDTGTVLSTTGTVPVYRLRLAQVVTAGGNITAVSDLRPRFSVLPAANTVKVLGGNGGQGDYTLSGAATFNDGLYYFRNFTIQVGATLTVGVFAKIYCSGNVTIEGAINITRASGGAAAYATGLPAGQNIGGLSGAGAGGGSGSGGGGGAIYPYTAQPFGSGGGLGFAGSSNGSGSVSFGAAGRGGGGLWIEAAGSIAVTGTINAQGGNAGAGTIISGNARLTGSGGGSGGLIYLSSLVGITISAAATLNVSGGNGANGLQQTDTGGAQGGAGGGGGYVVLVSPSNNTTGATITLTGGTKGADAGGTGLGGGAGGGFGGAGGNQSAGAIGQFRSLNFIPGSGG